MSHIPLSPTAYTLALQKQKSQTKKQLEREGKRQLAIAERAYLMSVRNSTAGQQFERLKHMRQVADEYGIELDVCYKFLLMSHEEVENAEGSQ